MDRVLQDFLDNNSGVLLASELDQLGYTWHAFKQLADSEGWTRLYHNAYVPPGTEDTPRVRALAIHRLRPRLVASHELAAFIHGFAVSRTPTLSFTSPSRSRFDTHGARHYRWHLPDEDIEVIEGLAVTVPERTIIDCMRSLDRDRAVIALDSALHDRLVHLDGVAARLERCGGDRGIPAAWLAFSLADPAAEAPTESKIRLIMWDRGLHPRSQVEVVARTGVRYRVDFDLEGLFVEGEGRIYHESAGAHEADVRRFNALCNALDTHNSAIRITWQEAFRFPARAGAAIVAAYHAHLRRRHRAASA